MASPVLFRSWTPSTSYPTYNCTVVEACRATTADTPIFAAIEVGEPWLKETFVGGSLRCNNPVQSVLHEAESTFPDQTISCVVSIGAGIQHVIGMKQPNDSTTAPLFDLLRKIATDCESTAQSVSKQLSAKSGMYFRLNVDQGLQEVGLTQWEEASAVQAHSFQYLRRHEVDEKVGQLVQTLIGDLDHDVSHKLNSL